MQEIKSEKSLAHAVRISICACVLASPSRTFADDPTFNGLMKTANCFYSTRGHCSDDHYCYTENVGAMNIMRLYYDFEHGSVTIPPNEGQFPIVIKTVSPAQINTEISVAFDVNFPKHQAKVTIVFQPRNEPAIQSYYVTSGFVVDEKEMYFGYCTLNGPPVE